MRNSVINIIETIIGAVLVGLGLIYLMSQYKVLSGLSNILTEKIIEDNKVFQQYNISDIDRVTHGEIYAAIMGYREYPIMVDNNLIPEDGQDYELYFSYIRNGLYQKQYQYDETRNIVMILYSYLGT